MAQFSVNAQRFDPYKNFKFRVKWDGRYVAGISKVSALALLRPATYLPSHFTRNLKFLYGSNR